MVGEPCMGGARVSGMLYIMMKPYGVWVTQKPPECETSTRSRTASEERRAARTKNRAGCVGPLVRGICKTGYDAM